MTQDKEISTIRLTVPNERNQLDDLYLGTSLDEAQLLLRLMRLFHPLQENLQLSCSFIRDLIKSKEIIWQNLTKSKGKNH